MQIKASDFIAIEKSYEKFLISEIDQSKFAQLLGLHFEEIRLNYARMRLPFRPEVTQPAGVMHGGAIASLIDTAVVGAIFSALDEPRMIVTVDLHIHYISALKDEDAIAQAWVRHRARSTVFLGVEVRSSSNTLIAHGELCYRVLARKRMVNKKK